MLAAILWSGLIMSGPSGFQPTAWVRLGVSQPGDLGVERLAIPLEVTRRIRASRVRGSSWKSTSGMTTGRPGTQLTGRLDGA